MDPNAKKNVLLVCTVPTAYRSVTAEMVTTDAVQRQANVSVLPDTLDHNASKCAAQVNMDQDAR
jgi:hypothetical protein